MHAENPYIKEDSKRMLAQKTGLQERQVANWFTNVRKRVWQPIKKQGANLSKYKKSCDHFLATQQLVKKVREKLMSEESNDFPGYKQSSNVSTDLP